MKDFFAKLREKPEKSRRKILYGSMIVSGFLVLSVWAGSMVVDFDIARIDNILLVSGEPVEQEVTETPEPVVEKVEEIQKQESSLATPFFVISEEVNHELRVE